MNYQSWILLAIIIAVSAAILIHLKKNKGKSPCSSCSGNCAQCRKNQ